MPEEKLSPRATYNRFVGARFANVAIAFGDVVAGAARPYPAASRRLKMAEKRENILKKVSILAAWTIP
jgi:uncharacterized membrane protein